MEMKAKFGKILDLTTCAGMTLNLNFWGLNIGMGFQLQPNLLGNSPGISSLGSSQSIEQLII